MKGSIRAAVAAALWVPFGAGMAQAADDRFGEMLTRIPAHLWDADEPQAFVGYVDFEALAEAVGLDLAEAWPVGEPYDAGALRARPFMIRSIRWQAPVTELWFSREAPLSALGLSLVDIGHMVHVSDDPTDIRLSLLAGGRQGLPMPSVEEALTTLGYVRASGDMDPWWGPPDPLPQSLPRTLMEQPFAATYADTLVFASHWAASLVFMAGDAPLLADDPHFAAAAAASAGRTPILQAVVFPGALFADPYASQEDIPDDQLPAFQMVLFTERQQGNQAESEMILVYDDEQHAARAYDELTARWNGPLAEEWLRDLADAVVTVEDPQSHAAGKWTVRSRAVNTIDPDDLGALPRTAYGHWLYKVSIQFDTEMLSP